MYVLINVNAQRNITEVLLDLFYSDIALVVRVIYFYMY
jgi:hypothetical protein